MTSKLGPQNVRKKLLHILQLPFIFAAAGLKVSKQEHHCRTQVDF